MNFALTLAANRLNGITVNWTTPADSQLAYDSAAVAAQPTNPARTAVSSPIASTPIPDTTSTPESEEQRLEAQLVAGGLSDDTRRALLDQFNQQAQNTQAQIPQPQTAQRDLQQSLIKPAAQPMPPRPANQRQASNALEKQDQLLAGLLLGSPEFQRR
jgi:hypothetical protein